MFKQYFKLLRIKHWIKNGLVFLPLIFSGNIFNFPLLTKSILAFFSFCFIASSVYLVNDIRDVEKDRLHEVKRNRPLASGAISLKIGWALFFVLLLVVIVINILSQNLFTPSMAVLIIYLIINLGYSFGLKNRPIIDIVILSTGFVLRVIGGSFITGIAVSNWLYLTIVAVSFFMGLGKRRNELLKQGDAARDVLKHYNYEFLDKFMYLCLTLVIVFYSLWCVDPQTIARFSNNYLVWTVPLVIVIFMKYSLIIENGSYGDPVDVLLENRLLVVLVLLYIVSTFCIVYINPISILLN